MAKKKVNTESKTKTKKRYATHLTTPTGERVYVSAKSQDELDAKVSKLKAEMGVGVDVSDNTLFNDYADLWLQVYKKPKVRESSYQQIEGHLRKNIKPVFEGKRLKDIKPIHIQSFLASISHYCNVAQRNKISVLRQIFDTAEDNGLIYKSPLKKSDRAQGEKTKEREPLSNEQARQLLDAVRGTPAYLFCLIALSTGMRRGEIMGLMWEDVDFDSGYINVRHNQVQLRGPARSRITTDLKTDSARRTLPMPLPLRYALEEECKQSESLYVFGGKAGSPPGQHSFDLIWRHVKVRMVNDDYPLGATRYTHGKGTFKVSLDFYCTAHLLRHTYITQLFESGLDLKQVQYLAGHATPELTMKVYTHYRQKQREQETTSKVLAAVSYLDTPHTSDNKVVRIRA